MPDPEAELARNGYRNLPFWGIVIALILADLLTKAWAFSSLPEYGVTPVWGDFLGWQRLLNPGGVFGIAQGLTTPLTIIRVFAVGLLIWLAAQQLLHNRRGRFTLALLTAGAVGNLYDNLGALTGWAGGSGHVRDFVRVDLGAAPTWWPDFVAWPFHPWPIFNLADSCITVGFVLILTGLGRIEWPGNDTPKKSAEEKAA